MRSFISYLIVFTLCSFVLNAATAQEAEKIKALHEDAYSLQDEITEGLDDAQKAHFYTAYSNYNILSTVKLVQKDVGNAIAACGKANPDMKDSLDTRFKDWNGAVSPVLSEAKAKIDNMVVAQDYTSKDKMRRLFRALDDLRGGIDSQINKIPVDTPEACAYLREKMDETQDRMVSLLRATLISRPEPVLDNSEGDTSL